MDINAFRYLYNYHFSEYHKIWDNYIIPLFQDQFAQEVSYSHGSIRNQVIHLINAENIWFTELRNAEVAFELGPTAFSDRKIIRTCWDESERMILDYLD
jgi:uncharacterized damage-inducible protein DinB